MQETIETTFQLQNNRVSIVRLDFSPLQPYLDLFTIAHLTRPPADTTVLFST